MQMVEQAYMSSLDGGVGGGGHLVPRPTLGSSIARQLRYVMNSIIIIMSLMMGSRNFIPLTDHPRR